MSQVKKETLDNAIRISKKFWDTGDADYLEARHKAMVDLAEEAFEDEYCWDAAAGLIDACIRLPRQAKNSVLDITKTELIYSVFKLFGVFIGTPTEAE